MSKLNKYLKSIAKELEKPALLSDADLNSVAGGVPNLVPLDALPPVNIEKRYICKDPKGSTMGFIMYTAQNGERVSYPTVMVNGAVYAVVGNWLHI